MKREEDDLGEYQDLDAHEDTEASGEAMADGVEASARSTEVDAKNHAVYKAGKARKKRKLDDLAPLVSSANEQLVIDRLNDIDHILRRSDMFVGQSVYTASPPVSRFLVNVDRMRGLVKSELGGAPSTAPSTEVGPTAPSAEEVGLTAPSTKEVGPTVPSTEVGHTGGFLPELIPEMETWENHEDAEPYTEANQKELYRPENSYMLEESHMPEDSHMVVDSYDSRDPPLMSESLLPVMPEDSVFDPLLPHNGMKQEETDAAWSYHSASHVGVSVSDGKSLEAVPSHTPLLSYVKDVVYPWGLAKIFDEALVNAADRTQEVNSPARRIQVTLDATQGFIEVWNDGATIPLVETPFESRADASRRAFQPELAFFHCRSSSAYKETGRTKGGKFGYGAKLIFIFSHRGEIECCDGEKRYVQRVTNHMRHVEAPEWPTLRKSDRGKSYTRIRFWVDVDLFYPPDQAPAGFDEVMMRVFLTRIWDVNATVQCKGHAVRVQWRTSTRAAFQSFEKVKTLRDVLPHVVPNWNPTQPPLYVATDRWQVCVFSNPFPFPVCLSYVNHLNTYLGGEHVRYIQQQILAYARTQLKLPQLDLRRVQKHVMVCVSALIEDADFTSQCKEKLVTTVTNFGSTCVLPTAFLNKLCRSSIMEDLRQSMEEKSKVTLRRDHQLKMRSSIIHDIPHCYDALKAGSRQRNKCTLFLVEGASAFQLAKVGIALLGGDHNGALALMGKPLNAESKSAEQMLTNKEVLHLCRLMGLEIGTVTPRDQLRYHRVVCMMDQDLDGSHIQALMIFIFRSFWPHLLREPGFLSLMITPLVVVSPSRLEREPLRFFTQQSFEQWFLTLSPREQQARQVKYYKGLATSSSEEGRYYFRHLAQHLRAFQPLTQADERVIDMVMGKTGQSQSRKKWLQAWQETNYLPFDALTQLSYEDFFNRRVIQFSWLSLQRGIAQCEDGCTPAMRKVLYTFLRKRNLQTHSVKVHYAQTEVAAYTNYHYGANSLGETIVRLAQRICGRRNVSFLCPEGQFGTRSDGGKTHGNTRYVQTRLDPLTLLLFPLVDLEVLPTRLEEGYEIEPSCLAPVLPILLMNGTRGLATGYTSFIPAYHPTVLLQLTRLRLSCSSLEACRNLYAQQHPEAGDQGPWIPWYQGFRGSITSVTSKSFTSRGVWTQVADHQYRVTELPLFTWTDAYRKLLLKLKDRGVIVDFREDPQEHVVVVDVFTNPTSTPEENWWSLMQLESVHTIQPTVFVVDPESFRTSLRTATSTWDLFESWYQYRFSVYQRRRVFVLQHMQAAIPGLIRTERFIQLVLSGVIALGQSHEQVMQTGQEHGFTPEELEGLMDLKFSKFTKEKVVQLQHQIQQAQTEADLYANKTIPMLWEEDLAPLEKAFQTHWQSWG